MTKNESILLIKIVVELLIMDNKEITIKDFVETNYKQLEIIAILGAIIGFINTTGTNWISYTFSFLILTCIVLVWFEINTKRNSNDNIRLEFFKYSIKLSLILLIVYILMKYRLMAWFALFLPISFIIIYIGIVSLLKFKRIRKIRDSKKIKDKISIYIIITLLTLISISLGIFISLFLNVLIDMIIKNYPI